MSRSHSTARRFEDRPSYSSRERAVQQPLDDFVAYLRKYARQEPEVAACVCLGVGFILGWKLKPW
jgi:hypothetical protein